LIIPLLAQQSEQTMHRTGRQPDGFGEAGDGLRLARLGDGPQNLNGSRDGDL
jgi:hypothetical protein